MANFQTHVTVAAAGSGLVSTVAFKASLVGAPEALVLTLAGIIGGILPDIDLKYSYPSKIIFSFLGLLSALLSVFSLSSVWSVLELWVFGLLVFLTLRYPLWSIFHKLTVHRGAIHSVAAGVLFLFLTAVLSFHILGHSPFFAWMLSFFVFFGFILHLVLDEAYSVDFMNRRVKRSFGSALKILDFGKFANSCFILVLSFFLWQVSPDFSDVLLAFDRTSLDEIKNTLLPEYFLRR